MIKHVCDICGTDIDNDDTYIVPWKHYNDLLVAQGYVVGKIRPNIDIQEINLCKKHRNNLAEIIEKMSLENSKNNSINQSPEDQKPDRTEHTFKFITSRDWEPNEAGCWLECPFKQLIGLGQTCFYVRYRGEISCPLQEMFNKKISNE